MVNKIFLLTMASVAISILSILFVAFFIIILFFSIRLSLRLRKIDPKKHEKIQGLIKDPVFGFQLRDNLEFWKWIFRESSDDPAGILEEKRKLKKLTLFFLKLLILIIILALITYSYYIIN